MEPSTATTIFEALSSPLRLEVYRLLVRHAPDGLVAGEISRALEVPPANLSFHLKALTRSGLLGVEQQGRHQRYRADMALMAALIGYLTDECCAGDPGRCMEGGDNCSP